jgi:ADP-ribosylglycohydrolase
VGQATEYYRDNPRFSSEFSHFSRILSGEIRSVPVDQIYTSGYIVYTLEAGIWSFMQHPDTRDILLTAVNLGLDTDTTGTIAGGLAGLAHGMGSIPDDWFESLARKQDIDALLNRYLDLLVQRYS